MDSSAQSFDTAKYFRVSKPAGLALLGLVLMCFVACAIMVKKNRDLVARNNERIDNAVAPKIGATISQITGLDTFGHPLHIALGDNKRKTLLLVFSPNCRVCGLNWPAWQRVANSVDKDSFRIVYVNGNARLTNEYLQHYQVPLTSSVIAEVDPGVLLRYNIVVTPETLLLDPSGKIEKAWIGMLEGEQLNEVDQSLRISDSEQHGS
jgi:hypothetical protein